MTLETIALLITAMGGSSLLTAIGQSWSANKKAAADNKKFDHEYLLQSFKISIDAITKQRDDAFLRVEQMQERMINLELEIMGLRLMLGHDPFPRWIINTNGEYLFVNQSFETMFLHPKNQTSRDVIGKTPQIVWGKEVADKLKRLEKRAIASSKNNAKAEISLTESASYTFYKMPIKVNDTIVGYIGYAIAAEDLNGQ